MKNVSGRAALAAGVALAGAAATVAAAGGGLGGEQRADPAPAPSAAPVAVASGTTTGGDRFELSAYPSARGLCLELRRGPAVGVTCGHAVGAAEPLRVATDADGRGDAVVYGVAHDAVATISVRVDGAERARARPAARAPGGAGRAYAVAVELAGPATVVALDESGTALARNEVP